MTDTQTIEPDTTDTDRDALDEYECCHEECDRLAVARATLLPCQHTAGYCAVHRKAVQRTFHWHTKAGTLPPCGACRTIVEAVAWGRM